jgi:hypothetical protein
MAKHRRHERDVLLAAGQYEQLVNILYRHRPGERSGLCLICGIGWPCTEVWLPLGRGWSSGELGQTATETRPEAETDEPGAGDRPTD